MQQQGSCRPDVFQDLFFRLSGALRRFVYYKSGNWEAAEDLVQESYLRLWKNCAEVPPEKAKSYLYTVANRLFLDEARHTQVALKFKQHSETAPPNHAPAPDFDLETREFQQKFEQALAALPEGKREVFLMNRLEKLTYAEIAERLDLSVKAVEKRMHGALMELRKLTEQI